MSGAVGNMSGCRCISDCRSRGGKIDPGLVPYFDEIVSTVILLPYHDSFKKGCCQLQAKVYAQSTSTINGLFKLSQEKSAVRWTDHPNMTIAVDWDVKQQTKR